MTCIEQHVLIIASASGPADVRDPIHTSSLWRMVHKTSPHAPPHKGTMHPEPRLHALPPPHVLGVRKKEKGVRRFRRLQSTPLQSGTMWKQATSRGAFISETNPLPTAPGRGRYAAAAPHSFTLCYKKQTQNAVAKYLIAIFCMFHFIGSKDSSATRIKKKSQRKWQTHNNRNGRCQMRVV